MAYGGYKFKGYKVVRSNLETNTYANWCLLVHQARIKAFIESCALSGALWHFSKTEGPLSFEDYGNVIYRVANANGDYHDYLSFFQYGDEDLYYMISTLGEYYYAIGDGTPQVSLLSRYCGTGSATVSSRKYKFMSFSSALSRTQFSDSGPFSSYPSDALSCSSQRTDYDNTSANWGSVNESNLHGASLADNTVYVGCVTKGKDIVWFKGLALNSCCIESGDAFSYLCNPDDTYGHLKLVLGFNSSEYTSTAYDNSTFLSYNNAECFGSNGYRLYSTDISTNTTYSNLTLIPDYLSYINAGGTKVPFSSFYLSTCNINLYTISSYKIHTKGLIKSELLSSNVYDNSALNDTPSCGVTVLGGNLIVCAKSTYTGNTAFSNHGKTWGYIFPLLTSNNVRLGVVCYAGWDPSNPDITKPASWPELSLYEPVQE